MSTTLLETPVGRLVAERPSRSRVLERYGLDYCCGGKKPLGEACNEKHLDVSAVVRDLQEADTRSEEPQTDWTTEPLADLCDYVVRTHHDYLREALPRLSFLTEKVKNAHGDRHPELLELAAVFTEFREELEMHMVKEEQILFPFIKKLELSSAAPSFHCGSLGNPIHVMEAEHEDAGAAMERMRELTNDYQPPQGACNTYRAMLDALAEMEADMHQHVHLENNVLFPRTIEREAALAAR